MLERVVAFAHSYQGHAVDPDHRVFLHGVSWKLLEQILAARGDRGGVRITYLAGELELMSPSSSHESIKTMIGRLLEAYAEEAGIDMNGVGSWTVRRKPKERAAEPDECYVIGPLEGRKEPDLAIEVIWTAGGIDKLEVYRELGVGEVWLWRDGAISVHVLRRGVYKSVAKSKLFPQLDLGAVAALATTDNQTAAVRTFRAALRAKR
jgi:Uma2 family endonuclease